MFFSTPDVDSYYATAKIMARTVETAIASLCEIFSSMLKLRPSLLIARGLHRACYVHPDNSDLCVKVVVNGGLEETRREQAYYRLLERRGASWDMLARFHGNWETDLGSGAVFDLIRDFDGGISQPLHHYLTSTTEDQEPYLQGLVQAFACLKTTLLRENIITMALKTANIVYRRTSDAAGTMVIIDGVGNSDLIPVASYIGLFAKRKILSKWRRFESWLQAEYPDNSLLRQLLKTPHR